MKRLQASKRRMGLAEDTLLTAAELHAAQPACEATSNVIEVAGKRGRPKGRNKTQVTLRLDNDLIRTLRATGDGWQTRVNDLLRAAIALRR